MFLVTIHKHIESRAQTKKRNLIVTKDLNKAVHALLDYAYNDGYNKITPDIDSMQLLCQKGSQSDLLELIDTTTGRIIPNLEKMYRFWQNN